MADIDTVLERLVTDTAFRAQLAGDPAAALAGYDLDEDDLRLLASSLDDSDATQRGVEQRTSKSAVIGLLASLAGGGGGGTGGEYKAPALDGASKDTAYLDDATPPADSEDVAAHKVPGKYKSGDITLKRGSMSAGDDLAPPEDVADALRKSPGRPKVGDITLERGADPGDAPEDAGIRFHDKTSDASAGKGGSIVVMDPTNAAPPGLDGGGDPEAAYAFKQGFPIKWQGASADAADGGDVDGGLAPDADTGAFPKKVEIGALKAGDTGVAVERGAGLPAEESDFLTIEDE